MNLPCQVMEDLLPLYAEGLTSPGTTQLVAEHLSQCPRCQKQLNALQAHLETPTPQIPLKQIRRSLSRRTANAVCLAAFSLLIILLVVFSYLSRPEYIPYSDTLLTIESQDSGMVYATFSSEVTSCRMHLMTDPDTGEPHLYLEGWTCAWDRLLGKDYPQTLIIDSPERPISGAYYCDYEHDGTATLVYGQKSAQGNLFVLPRLVLGYYLILALGLAVITGLGWLLLRKTQYGRIGGYVFCVPVSYVLGHFLMMGPGTLTYQADWDFALILFATACVYGFLISGVLLIRRIAADRKP